MITTVAMTNDDDESVNESENGDEKNANDDNELSKRAIKKKVNLCAKAK